MCCRRKKKKLKKKISHGKKSLIFFYKNTPCLTVKTKWKLAKSQGSNQNTSFVSSKKFVEKKRLLFTLEKSLDSCNCFI